MSMQKAPKISIIIPVYNAEKYLNRCLESLICQSLKNIEIICVNDGSSDRSPNILKEYAQKDKRIKIIDQENQGVAAARNAGIDIAKGKYLGFVDADDWVDYNFYERLYTSTNNLQIDIVKGNTARIFNDKTEKKGDLNNNIKSSRDHIVSSFQYEWWSAIYKRDLIINNNIKFQKALLAEDQLFLTEVLCVSKSFEIINDVYYYYFQNPLSLTHKITPQHITDLFRMYRRIITVLQNNRIPAKDQAKVIQKRILYILIHKNFCYKNNMKKFFEQNLFYLIQYLNSLHSDINTFNSIKKINDLKKYLSGKHRVTEYKLFNFIPLLSIEEKIAPVSVHKTISKNFERFLYHDIPEKSILMVEFNDFHGECLPGIAKYFIDLGYHIDVCLSPSEMSLEPFSDFVSEKISLFSMTKSDLKRLMEHDICERYVHIYLNSDRVYDKGFIPILDYIGKDIKFPQGKLITMCHHADQFNDIKPLNDKFAVVALNKLPVLEGQKYFMVNSHYFGKFERNNKHDITNFICVGNIESHRKNHSLLFEAIDDCLKNGITNFKVTIIARSGNLDIPEHIRPYLNFKGRLSYKEMYEQLKQADFYLPLFDPCNPLHERYLSSGSSGSYQLIYGFKLPSLICYKFQTNVNGFDESNSLGYSQNQDLGQAMKTAVLMTNKEYMKKVSCLKQLSEQIYEESLQNLKNLLKEPVFKYSNNFFISLGENCFNRTVLSRHNLKQHRNQGELSFPFDLCVCPLPTVYNLIKKDFADYFEGLSWDEQNHLWINNKHQIRYNHDRDCSEYDKDKLIERYTRRIENFRNILKDDKEHMFIISSIDQSVDMNHILELYKYLAEIIHQKFSFVYINLGKKDLPVADYLKNKALQYQYKNAHFYYQHIAHPYSTFWNEWYKLEYFNSERGIEFEKKFTDYIQNLIQEKRKTYYIVSGGFDPLHEGHIANILESAAESDGVIALINSDNWLCRKKGKNFMSLYTRKTIINAIKGVIETIEFDDSDNSACDGLRKIRSKYPVDYLVFAKGGDRTADNIPEIDVCRELDIKIKYNVGYRISGTVKPNSSSWILKNWDNRKSEK